MMRDDVERAEDRIVALLKWATLRRPALGLRLAGMTGAALAPWLGPRWSPAREELAGVLPLEQARRTHRIRREIAAQELRNRALMALANRRGPEVLAERVDVVGADALLRLRGAGAPVVLVMCRIGAFRAIPAALARLGLPTLMAVTSLPRRPQADDIVRSALALPGVDGTAFLKRALAELRRGGLVALVVDGERGADPVHAPCLGRRGRLQRGAATLARLTGAQLLPVTSRWIGTSSRAEVAFHAPLPSPSAPPATAGFESELLESMAGFFDAHVRAHPGTLRLVKLRELVAAEPLARLAWDAPGAVGPRPGWQ
jgi:lauroyl/myristoyl acyltransferase